MTSDPHAADSGESTGQVHRPGPLVHRGAVPARPRSGTSVLLPPLVARGPAREQTQPGASPAPPNEAAAHALDPAARDFLEVSGASDAAAEPVAASHPLMPVEASATTPDPSPLEEVDLPWLTTPEDEDALESGNRVPEEDGRALSEMAETPAADRAGADAIPPLGEDDGEVAVPRATRGFDDDAAARAGTVVAAEAGEPAGAGEDAFPEDPALMVAERLERIAQSLRTRGVGGPLVDEQGDPLAALVAGYLLGITESKGR